MIITNEELNKTVRVITVQETLRLDHDRVREDFYGLYGDIVAELAHRAPGRETLIYDYDELMEREQSLYIPEQAYEAGVSSRGADRNRAFMDYARRLLLDTENQRFLNERDTMFYELRGLLGEAGGLLDEFNDLFRRCRGIIGRKIDVFFDMGFFDTGKLNEE